MNMVGFGVRAAIAAIAGGVASVGGAQAEDITVGAFGGVWEESLRTCVIEPFEAETGHTVNVTLGTPVQWINQIAASPQDPPIDVFYTNSDHAFTIVDSGLVEKLTVKQVPAISELEPYFAEIGDGYGVVHNYGSMGLIYNKETVANPPKTWPEFVDGVVAGDYYAAVPSINYTSTTSTTMWNFAEIYGGGVDNLDPGMEKIKAMDESGNVTYWSDPNQVLTALMSGEIDIAMYWDGRAWAFIDDGNDQFDYINPEPGSVAAMTWIEKVKNGSDVGWDFIRAALDAKAQGCFGSHTRYGVANTSAEFDPAVAEQITQFDELAFPPFQELTDVQGDWIERWNKEIGR